MNIPSQTVFSLFMILITIMLTSCSGSDIQTNHTLVKVFKYDNSIQCESQGIKLEDMQRDLSNAGIGIICSQKGHDGLARISVCGAATGNINVYQISATDLDSAIELEFMHVNNLSDYQDAVCE